MEKLNPASPQNKSSGLLVVISGPSGSGKSTLCRQLKKDDGVWLSVSATTRPPRPGEVDGEDYYFVSRDEFHRLVNQAELLEFAQYGEHYYGTPKRPVLDAMQRGLLCLLEIDVQGAEQIRRQFKDALFVFVIAPNEKELRRRLAGRKGSSPEQINARLQIARREMKYLEGYDCCIVNDDIDQAIAKMRELLAKNRRKKLPDGSSSASDR